MRRACELVLVWMFILAGVAQAQDFPNRPMTMIVPFPAGGNADGVARVVAHRMGELLGQRVVVENVAAPAA